MADWLASAAIGLVSGALSGAFGIGGGIVTTPAIRLLMGAPALIAVGTPLPVIIPGALTGAVSYARAGLADVRSGVILGLAGAPFSIAGAWLATRLGGTVVLVGTAALIIWAAGDMLLQAYSAETSRQPDSPAADEGAARGHSLTRTWLLVGVGALAGLYSGFLGLGGGFIIVPILTRTLRFPIKLAVGTSLVTVSLLAIPGTLTHAALGNVDWTIAAGLVIGVVPGALIGSRMAIRAADRHVRIAFALLLVVVAVWLGVHELSEVW